MHRLTRRRTASGALLGGRRSPRPEPIRIVVAYAAVVLGLASCTIGAEPAAPMPTTAASTAAASPTDPLVPDLRDASCQEIRLALAGAREALETAVRDLSAAPAAFAQVAANLRAAAADAGADARAAAEELAAGFDELAEKIRDGDLMTLNMEPLMSGLDAVGAVCL